MGLITASIGELKDGLPEYIRRAEQSPVLVRRRDKPVVLMVGVEDVLRAAGGASGGENTARDVLRVVAVNMFDQGLLSMGQAARFAGMPLDDFIDLSARLGVPVLRESELGVADEVDEFERWLESSRASSP